MSDRGESPPSSPSSAFSSHDDTSPGAKRLRQAEFKDEYEKSRASGMTEEEFLEEISPSPTDWKPTEPPTGLLGSYNEDAFSRSSTEFEQESQKSRHDSRAQEEADEELRHVSPSDKQSAVPSTDLSNSNGEASAGDLPVGSLHTSPSDKSLSALSTGLPTSSGEASAGDVSVDAPAEDPNIGMICTVAGCNKEDATRWLQVCGGDLQKAMLMALTPTLRPPIAKQPKARTLLDEALAAYSTKQKKRSGDMLVILDGNDLSRSFRMLSEDAAEASNLLGIECLPEADSNANGIKYLLVLKKADGTGMPLLARLDLSTLRADCGNDLYTGPIDPAHNDAAKVKRESNSAEPEEQAPVDWLAAYESFLRILSGSKDSGIPTASIDDALPRIEAVAQIAHFYRGKVVEKAIRTLLASEFDFNTRRGQLWSAIAKDPARWLVVANHLQSRLLYEEAFIHVAGAFPGDSPWGIKFEDIPW